MTGIYMNCAFAPLQQMQIFRMMLRFRVPRRTVQPHDAGKPTMIRMPLASASLLAIAIALAATGE
ncbi:hypothetical protein, partial [Pseudomonas sp. SIMBA_067]|uniref:hypothetical protein n=1 Tax=Pseudomonas sp. SIMBA_067 TaxID=3085807 RepID=UPI00397D478A